MPYTYGGPEAHDWDKLPPVPRPSWGEKDMYNTFKAPVFLGAVVKTGFRIACARKLRGHKVWHSLAA